MAIQGLRDSTNFVTNEAPENWRQGLLMLYPNAGESVKAPLTALTSLMKSRSVDDPRYHWWEKSLDDRRLQLHATAVVAGGNPTAATAGTVEVWALKSDSNALMLKARDLLMVEHTKEILQVTEDPSSNTSITVRRGFSGSTTVAIDPDGVGVNPNIVVIGSAFEEGSRAPTGINFDPEEQYNYLQIFR